jgi:hypothetical protein
MSEILLQRDKILFSARFFVFEFCTKHGKAAVWCKKQGASMASFIGRKRELLILGDLLKRRIASFVVVKGRRRIGNSRLIAEFAKDLRFLTFTGLPPSKGVSAKQQREEFARQLARLFTIPIPYSDD